MNSKNLAGSNDRNLWVGASLHDRFKKLDSVYIKHPPVQKILAYMEQELVSRTADGKTSGLLVISPPGAGKTSLIQYLQLIYPAVVTDEFRTCPVVAFCIPPAPTPKTMGAAMLKSMGDPLWDRGTAGKKLDRIRGLLVSAKAKLVLIDNFQDIPMRRKSKGVLNVAGWLRDVCDTNFGGLVVAIGTVEAEQVRDGNEQIQRRIQARLNLPVFAGQTREELQEFSKLLRGIDRALPLAEESGIYLGDMPKRIHCATRGNFDYLVKLIKKTMEVSLSKGSECLSMQDFFEAFEKQHQEYAYLENPFDDDFRWSELAQPGQVFHNIAFSVNSSEMEAIV